MRGRGNERQEPWLLIKERDETARPAAEYDITEALPDSVNANNGAPAAAKLGQSSTTVKKTSKKRSADAVALPDGARKAKLPLALAPQLALLADSAPTKGD